MTTAPSPSEAIMKAPILLASLVLLAGACTSPTAMDPAPPPVPGSLSGPQPVRESDASRLQNPVIGGTPAALSRNPVIGGTP